LSLHAAPLTRFELPDSLSAVEPPEERGIRREQVRLLVADGESLLHRRFDDLPDQLAPGDLVVVNTSATLPAAVDGELSDARRVVVHFATALDDGNWVVEVRPAVRAHGPVTRLCSGDRVRLPGSVSATLLTAYPDSGEPATRLWRAAISVPDVLGLLHQHGRPITYGYMPERWPLDSYQTNPGGSVSSGHGWTHLVLGQERPARVVDGLITGWYTPGASHLLLLEAVAGADLVSAAYEEAIAHGYLWHEFGDSLLLLPHRREAG
jgi:S-adenosylmethionine:tRNA-ribosyltransferase-isomerase (queuine synthetase)